MEQAHYAKQQASTSINKINAQTDKKPAKAAGYTIQYDGKSGDIIMKPKQIVIYGLLSFLIASSLAMYVYLDHRLPQYDKTSTSDYTQKIQIESLSDLKQRVRYELK